jgi:arsenate reductase (thioredoxin)
MKSLEEFYQEVDRLEISKQRQELLLEIAKGIQLYLDQKISLNLLFVCTHNSRRSQFGQLWATYFSRILGLSEHVSCYSAGTEATECNIRTIRALESAGFRAQYSVCQPNPKYDLFSEGESSPIRLFSKTVDDNSIPKENIIALMTCSDAEENCPLVHGTLLKYSLNYKDPKEYDNTPEEKEAYWLKSKEIASEILFILKQLKK